MGRTLPLVSIGIPTYNRAGLLKRSIESALNQNYRNLEVIVSDNHSIDETKSVCQHYHSLDKRFRYIRQPRNLGPGENFAQVLRNSSGQFFMWLADDDWLDANYVDSCVKQFESDLSLALVSGTIKYYLEGQKAYDGKVFDLPYDAWWLRVIVYYTKVMDNGMFYGLMNIAKIRTIDIPNTMGGDWLFLGNIISMGKARVVQNSSIHRELGGATATYRKIASSLGLPAIQALLPMVSIAMGAFMDIAVKGEAYRFRSRLDRFWVGGIVFFIIMLKSAVRKVVFLAKSYLGVCIY